MGVGATLNGHRVTSARVNIPAWGCWSADVHLDGEHTLSGRVTLSIADATFVGTVLSGGATKGRSQYRLVAGAGGWGKTLRSKSYTNDAGVKLSTVLGDAAREAGETLGTVASSRRLGPAWTRQARQARAVLELAAPRGWYVDEAGVTQVGARAARTLPANITRVKPVDLARGVVLLASESIAALLPGTTIDGLLAVDVQHEISAKGGLRTTVWGARGGGSSRALEAFRVMLDIVDPDRAFRGVTEYRVDTTDGKRLNLQVVRVSTGMPDLERVVVRPGVPGCEADLALGSRVLVAFIDSDPARPCVVAFEDADGDSFVPTTLTLAEGSAFLARVGDSISISPSQFAAASPANGSGPVTITNPMAGSISSGSSKVRCG